MDLKLSGRALQLARGGGGVKAANGAASAVVDRLDANKGVAARDILSDLPIFIRDKVGYFSQVPVPAGLTIAAGMSAWYGLRRISVDDAGQEFAYCGHDVDMLSCDWNTKGIPGIVGTGGGVGSALPWGDATGCTAAMVIGINLPFREVGTWIGAPADIEGIQAITGATQLDGNKLSATTNTEYLSVEHFPPGTFDRATPGGVGMIRATRNYLGGMRPINGGTLDIALVVAGTYVNGLAAARVICGRGSIRPLILPLSSIGGVWGG